jgi:hypothetical protein
MGMTGVITGLPLFLLKPVKSLSPAVKTGHDPVGPSSSWAKVQVAALEGAAPRVVMPRRPKALSPRTIERLAGSMEVVQACPESIGVYSLNCATARRPVVKLSGSWLRVGAAKLSHGKASAHLLHRIVSRKSDAGRSAPGAVRSGCGSRCGQGRQGFVPRDWQRGLIRQNLAVKLNGQRERSFACRGAAPAHSAGRAAAFRSGHYGWRLLDFRHRR